MFIFRFLKFIIGVKFFGLIKRFFIKKKSVEFYKICMLVQGVRQLIFIFKLNVVIKGKDFILFV